VNQELTFEDWYDEVIAIASSFDWDDYMIQENLPEEELAIMYEQGFSPERVFLDELRNHI